MSRERHGIGDPRTGSIDSVAVIDKATRDLISIQETVHGPHPLRDGVDICGPSVAYLTSL
jgi:hypothetical protein